jgi:hypothetical protein
MGLLRRWQAKHLLLSWAVYWVVLALVALRPALTLVARALGGPEGHGSISADVSNGVANLNVAFEGQRWTGSTSLTSLALWIAGPPLLLWLVWLVTRRAPSSAREGERDFRIS